VGSSGLDLIANIDKEIVLKPSERTLVPTGLSVAIPENYEIQIRPRSGLAAKNGISVLNTPGTVDADYRGEIKVILINLSLENFKIEPGQRIAQMVLCPVVKAELLEVDTLPESVRGSGGFGSTGR
jgi:dUTP pyrophosphatase